MSEENLLVVVIHVIRGRHIRQELNEGTFVRVKLNETVQVWVALRV
jgi:hypothetical protein